MKHTILFFLLCSFLLFPACNTSPDMNKWKEIPKSDFLKSQLQFPRVRSAFQKKDTALKVILLKNEIYSFDIDLYLRAFKQEEIFEVWAKPKTKRQYQLIQTYDFCETSGTLGPKRIEGDGQIPEGFYRISHYNPKSLFLLSLKVNYPNAADKILSHSTKPGGDIYIHGDCQTVGCIPLTDDKIQEVYLPSVLSKVENQAIPIHIFPFKMAEQNLRKNLKIHPEQEAFWSSLQTGFEYFEEKKIIPNIDVNNLGLYLLNQ